MYWLLSLSNLDVLAWLANSSSRKNNDRRGRLSRAASSFGRMRERRRKAHRAVASRVVTNRSAHFSGVKIGPLVPALHFAARSRELKRTSLSQAQA
jgi:hypothetical protein